MRTATHPDCQHPRHELPVHARTQPSLRLPLGPGADDCQRHRAHVVLQEAGVVEVISLQQAHTLEFLTQEHLALTKK
jgi:hypothetical protein